MGYQIYKLNRNRWAGYGVPVWCDHPDCKEEIDRGISCACGEAMSSELGCDRYFCEKHRSDWYEHNPETGEKCEHKEDCLCDSYLVCERCKKGELPFDEKPEHHDWVKHVLNDDSWKEWRGENEEQVKKLREN